jgi:hypothetical protein
MKDLYSRRSDCESAIEGALESLSVEEDWRSEAASRKLEYGVYMKSTSG